MLWNIRGLCSKSVKIFNHRKRFSAYLNVLNSLLSWGNNNLQSSMDLINSKLILDRAIFYTLLSMYQMQENIWWKNAYKFSLFLIITTSSLVRSQVTNLAKIDNIFYTDFHHASPKLAKSCQIYFPDQHALFISKKTYRLRIFVLKQCSIFFSNYISFKYANIFKDSCIDPFAILF